MEGHLCSGGPTLNRHFVSMSFVSWDSGVLNPSGIIQVYQLARPLYSIMLDFCLNCPNLQRDGWMTSVYQGTSEGGGPSAVVKSACLESQISRVRAPLWHSIFNKEKMFTRSPQLVGRLHDREVYIYSVLDLRPPELEFRILCLEGSAISYISQSSGGSPCPV